jgi:tetratricopeptide (TPR) repeat protein
MRNKTKIIFAVSAVIIIAIILLLTGAIQLKKIPIMPDNNTTASTTEKTVGGVTYTGSGNLKIEQVPVVSNVEPPSLDRPVVFPKNYSQEAKMIMGKNIEDIASRLKKNSSSVDDWINLGIYRKEIEDYDGAKEAWSYASLLNPNNPVPFSNLGDLYGYYLKDKAMAEINILKAVEKDPASANWYVRAADFYREVEDDLAKAKAILEKGLVAIPNDASLIQAIDNLNTTPIHE